jgi:hypothetical protein
MLTYLSTYLCLSLCRCLLTGPTYYQPSRSLNLDIWNRDIIIQLNLIIIIIMTTTKTNL